jgi:uncharacterized protein (TIGR03437 family)
MNSRVCSIRVSSVATLIPLLTLAVMAPSAPAQVRGVVIVISTPNPVVLAGPATFTAGVNWTTSAVPSGTISLTDTAQCGGANAAATVVALGTITLGSAASATPGAGTLVVTSFPCVGLNSIVGAYGGDSHYADGVSAPLIETVVAQLTPTTIALSTSPNPAAAGQSVTLAAQLNYTVTQSMYPTGAVTFTDTTTGNVLGTANLQTSGSGVHVSTSASITTSSLAAGAHTLQAAYPGNGLYGPSTSQYTQVIQGGGAAGPGIAANGVVNGASFQTGIAADSWVTILGTNLAPTTDNWGNSVINGTLPTTLDGVSVTMDGKPTYISYISSGQLNVLAPDLSPGPVTVTVTTPNGAASVSTVTASLYGLYGPAFFLWPGNQAVATRTDFSPAAKSGSIAGAVTVPAKPGDIIILWGTGFGPTNPAAPVGVVVPLGQIYTTLTTPTVTIDNVPAMVLSAALAPGSAGLYQIAIQVPNTLTNGDWPIQASIGGVSSPSNVLLTVQQ